MEPLHRKRCRLYDIAGDSHFLTFSCYKRLPLLSRPRSCQWMVQALDHGRERQLYDLWAYVIMPEHVHLVLLPQPNVRMQDILKAIKQSVSRRALTWLADNEPRFLERLADVRIDGSKTHRFWQRGGGYDRNLRSVADIYEKIEYVHNNPVRRQFITRPEDWAWSSAHAWKTGIDKPIAIDRSSLPRLA